MPIKKRTYNKKRNDYQNNQKSNNNTMMMALGGIAAAFHVYNTIRGELNRKASKIDTWRERQREIKGKQQASLERLEEITKKGLDVGFPNSITKPIVLGAESIDTAKQNLADMFYSYLIDAEIAPQEDSESQEFYKAFRKELDNLISEGYLEVITRAASDPSPRTLTNIRLSDTGVKDMISELISDLRNMIADIQPSTFADTVGTGNAVDVVKQLTKQTIKKHVMADWLIFY